MLMIKIVLTIAIAANAVLATTNSHAFVDVDDLLMKASPDAESLLASITAARSLKESGKTTGVEGEILDQLIALESIATGAEGGRYDCSRANIEKMHSIHKLMEAHSGPGAYVKPNVFRRLNTQMISLQTGFGSACFKKLKEESVELLENLDEETLDKMQIIDQLFKKGPKPEKLRAALIDLARLGRLEGGSSLLPLEKKVGVWARVIKEMAVKSGENRRDFLATISAEKVKQVYQDYLLKTCDYLEQQKELVRVLDDVDLLVRSVHLNNGMISHATHDIKMLVSATIEHRLCQDLAPINPDEVASRVSENISKSEVSHQEES